MKDRKTLMQESAKLPPPAPAPKAPRAAVQRPFDEALAALDPEVPLVLFPVRLETRFRDEMLQVRIYPDEVLADGHEPELTPDERAAAERFWAAVTARQKPRDPRDAWRELVAENTPQRAAWILRVTDPSGPGARRGAPERMVARRPSVAPAGLVDGARGAIRAPRQHGEHDRSLRGERAGAPPARPHAHPAAPRRDRARRGALRRRDTVVRRLRARAAGGDGGERLLPGRRPGERLRPRVRRGRVQRPAPGGGRRGARSAPRRPPLHPRPRLRPPGDPHQQHEGSPRGLPPARRHEPQLRRRARPLERRGRERRVGHRACARRRPRGVRPRRGPRPPRATERRGHEPRPVARDCRVPPHARPPPRRRRRDGRRRAHPLRTLRARSGNAPRGARGRRPSRAGPRRRRGPSTKRSSRPSLVRHARVWELARLADTLAGALDLHLDPELITTPEDAPHIVWNRLDDAFRNDARRAELLRDARPYDEALQRLETLPSAELERLLTETLDVCSHRIDAWETSLYAERLKQMRVRRPRGCHLGAWGVVENVRRREAFEAQTAGYIHAPSLDHAATAAILLNAHRTYVGEDAERFRIDLSSARVRDALEVLAAVRAGQRFDDAVARVTAGDAARGQSARDAIGDLLTAESVFQIVRGNPAAGGASLDALGKGHRPPEPEVVRSGRGGAAVTHRVMLGFESQSSAMGAWRSPRAGPRPLGG